MNHLQHALEFLFERLDAINQRLKPWVLGGPSIHNKVRYDVIREIEESGVSGPTIPTFLFSLEGELQRFQFSPVGGEGVDLFIPFSHPHVERS
jgi:hypothetical protein